MWQLSRQKISRQINAPTVSESITRLKKKQVLVIFESRTFAVPGIFVASRLSQTGTRRNLNYLVFFKKNIRDESKNPDIYGKKSSTRLQYPCLLQW